MRSRFWVLGVVLLGGRALTAQVAGADDIRAEIRQLREQIDRLEQRLSERTSRAPVEPATLSPATRETTTMAADPPPRVALPLDISGFFASTGVRTGLAGPFANYQTHSASIFLGKTLGNWSFHSEMEFNYGPQLEHGANPLGASAGEAEMETAWMNYKQADWLNVRAGMLFLPTYWRLHSYPSTTMTAQAPLLYESIFPPNIAGVMIHGSKYFEDNGFTYTVYGGQGREFLDAHHNSRDAVGASVIAHLPSHHWLSTFDIGAHRYLDRVDEGRRSVWGLESRIERDRFRLLSEYARGRIGSGGDRSYVRGYYLQPSVRLAGQVYGVYRYDRLTGSGEPERQRHTFGALFRPVPSVALKLEYNRYPAESKLPARNGLAAGVSFFVQ